LQEKTAEGWQDSSALPCAHDGPGDDLEDADVMHIASGATYSATIHLGAGSGAGATLAHGTYRFTLTYSTFTVPPHLAGGMGDGQQPRNAGRDAGADGLPAPLGKASQRLPFTVVYSPEWQVT
jgi:hypothetical protein